MSNVIWIEFASNDNNVHRGFNISISTVPSGCGGYFHGKTDEIASINFPGHYPNNIECIWYISVPPGFNINITFLLRFDLERSDPCLNKDYLEFSEIIHDERNVIKRFCDKQLPDPFQTSSEKLQILFHTNEVITGEGFKLKWQRSCGHVFTDDVGTIFSPNYPEHYDDNLYCVYNISTNPDNYVVISFDGDFSIEEHKECVFDYLEIRGYTPHGFKSDRICGPIAPTQSSYKGSVIVIFKTDHVYEEIGFNLTYKIRDCGGNLTESSGEFHPPTHPTRYFPNMNCIWTIYGPNTDLLIELRFISFDLEQYNYGCYDKIEVFDGASIDSPKIATLCESVYPNIITSSSNTMTVKFTTDGWDHETGFHAVYRETFGPKQGCGGLLNTTEGTFSSIDWNHDGKYEPNLRCIWQINVNEDKIVKLTFQTFDIEPSANTSVCVWDYLEIHDGLTDTSPLIGKYCGGSKPTAIHASANSLWVMFISDNSKEYAGFQAIYSSESRICGGHLYASNESQEITSPGFPNENYPGGIRCVWFLHANGYDKLEITFKQFDLEDSDFCIKDYLKIEDITQGYYRFEPKHATFCGSTIPHSFHSASNNLKLSFASDGENRRKGFKLAYQIQTCNTTYQEDNGIIKLNTDNYSWYSRNAIGETVCTMKIEVQSNQTISLYFSSLRLQWSRNCTRSYLKFEDVNATSSVSIGTFCGYALPGTIHSSSNQIIIHFYNSQRNRFNYELLYTATDQGPGCGGTLHAIQGRFTSPFYPSTYMENKECKWRIIVPSGGTVKVGFTFLDIGNNTNECSGNYVAFYNTGTETETGLVGKYCGQTHVSTLSGLKNEALVKLVTNSENRGTGFSAYFYYEAWQDISEPVVVPKS